MAQDANVTYKKLLEIRQSKTLKLSPNQYVNPTISFRYYQIQGIVHMFMVKAFLLGFDTGLGKTCVSLGAYATILSKFADYKMLIVCPSSAMYQWQGEVDKFCTGLTSQIVEAGDIKVGKKKLKSFDSREYLFNQFETNKNNILIMNYNTLQTDFHVIKGLMERYKFMIIYDECTAFKNQKTNTWKYAYEVARLADRVYGLSATPIKNRLMEMYAIFKVLIPALFTSDVKFKNDYCEIEKIQLWKGKGQRGRVVTKVVGYKNLDYFKRVIDPYFLGKKKSEVADELPEITSKEVIIKMTKEQRELYNDALKGFLDYNKFSALRNNLLDDLKTPPANVTPENLKLINKLGALMYCQQICDSPQILGFDAPSIKEAELLRLLESELCGEKVVIYTRFKKMINRLESVITQNLDIKCLKITGDIDNKTREDYKKLFNTSPDHNIMLINAAAKEAVNLQSSGYVIFFDLPYSYGDFLQIIGRIHRIGSTHEKIVLIYLICQGTIDQKIYKILTSKKDLFNKVLGDSAVGSLKEDDSTSAVVKTLFDDMILDAKNLFTE